MVLKSWLRSLAQRVRKSLAMQFACCGGEICITHGQHRPLTTRAAGHALGLLIHRKIYPIHTTVLLVLLRSWYNPMY